MRRDKIKKALDLTYENSSDMKKAIEELSKEEREIYINELYNFTQSLFKEKN